MPFRNIAKTIVNSDEAKGAAIKTAGGAAMYGLTLNEWVAVVTFIYFVLQIAFLIRRELRSKKNEEDKN